MKQRNYSISFTNQLGLHLTSKCLPKLVIIVIIVLQVRHCVVVDIIGVCHRLPGRFFLICRIRNGILKAVYSVHKTPCVSTPLQSWFFILQPLEFVGGGAQKVWLSNGGGEKGFYLDLSKPLGDFFRLSSPMCCFAGIVSESAAALPCLDRGRQQKQV